MTIFLLALAGCLMAVSACAPPRGSQVVVGAKNFTEQVVLGELLAQEIEASGGGKVERRFYLAGSYLCQQAMVSGRIDAYVEYSGTALTAILKQPVDRDAERVRATIARLYEERYGVRVGPGLGFEDTFAMVVRGEDARRLGVMRVSDVAGLQSGGGELRVSPLRPPSAAGSGRDDKVGVASAAGSGRDDNSGVGVRDATAISRLGVGYEFAERPDGLRGLSAAYGLKFQGSPRTMELGLLYRALAARQVDIVAGNSTDGAIRALDFVALEDDRHYFPPYEAVPLVREESLKRWPQIGVAVERLAGKVSAEEMRAMNLAVESAHRDVGDVVREFRGRKGL